MTEEVTNPDLRSQEERQLDLIRDLNSRVPSNPQGDTADAELKKILQSPVSYTHLTLPTKRIV